jgi:hypothetical protein
LSSGAINCKSNDPSKVIPRQMSSCCLPIPVPSGKGCPTTSFTYSAVLLQSLHSSKTPKQLPKKCFSLILKISTRMKHDCNTVWIQILSSTLFFICYDAAASVRTTIEMQFDIKNRKPADLARLPKLEEFNQKLQERVQYEYRR